MMKSWADHCSSDEESIGDEIAEELENTKLDEPAQPDEDEQQAPQEEAAPQERLYDFPDKPPFTAFVGNLAFTVKEQEQLTTAVADAVAYQLGAQINVIGGRIATDRRDGKHRGFGYVEVETLDEVRLGVGAHTLLDPFLFGRYSHDCFLCLPCLSPYFFS